ncbi:hypothetical protein HMPREF9696_03536 [Afipia clevelandensis ATCC 49720]|uniref:Uncharacterized protein n=1 Tax=Afipia clevelandensis ATCC 49720 TaxID=883079 RepID=K8NVN0_9BRAD|nr:hypothetical protein HMPREF9696_03536 [Afipia clevelandensis ATCC 49720]
MLPSPCSQINWLYWAISHPHFAQVGLSDVPVFAYFVRNGETVTKSGP